MAVVPCSMGTLGRIAAGTSDNNILRAADVFLKERRRLILVPRETPWNLIHARNVVTVMEAGATVLPAVPSFLPSAGDGRGRGGYGGFSGYSTTSACPPPKPPRWQEGE